MEGSRSLSIPFSSPEVGCFSPFCSLLRPTGPTESDLFLSLFGSFWSTVLCRAPMFALLGQGLSRVFSPCLVVWLPFRISRTELLRVFKFPFRSPVDGKKESIDAT